MFADFHLHEKQIYLNMSKCYLHSSCARKLPLCRGFSRTIFMAHDKLINASAKPRKQLVVKEMQTMLVLVTTCAQFSVVQYMSTIVPSFGLLHKKVYLDNSSNSTRAQTHTIHTRQLMLRQKLLIIRWLFSYSVYNDNTHKFCYETFKTELHFKHDLWRKYMNFYIYLQLWQWGPL